MTGISKVQNQITIQKNFIVAENLVQKNVCCMLLSMLFTLGICLTSKEPNDHSYAPANHPMMYANPFPSLEPISRISVVISWYRLFLCNTLKLDGSLKYHAIAQASHFSTVYILPRCDARLDFIATVVV